MARNPSLHEPETRRHDDTSLPWRSEEADRLNLPNGLEQISETLRKVAETLSETAALQRASLETKRAAREKSPPHEAQMLASAARRYLKHRRRREGLFAPGLFADPAWDLLLDLYASGVERLQVPVTSACIAAAVPASTALRWIGALEEQDLVHRVADKVDGRRAFLTLSPRATELMADWVRGMRDLFSEENLG